jgi:hypothetical protein
MQIRESEVKTREAELEAGEAELKDRQAAMLIRLDEQERDYTLCDLSPTYQPAERMSTVLEDVLGEPAGTSSSCLGWMTKFPDRPIRLARQHQAMLLFLQQKAANSGFDPPKRTSIFRNSASVVVEYEFFMVL